MKFFLNRNEAAKFWIDRFKNSVVFKNATASNAGATTIHKSDNYMLKVTPNASASETEYYYEIHHK